MSTRRIPAVAALLAATTLSAAHANLVQFDDFADTTGLTLNGSATTTNTADGTVLRLTPAASGRGGSVFSSTTVDADEFATFFKFRITEPGGATFDNNNEPGADGIVFVVQSISNSQGSSGGGIGYAGIGQSVGVEFDTWGNNSLNDPSQSHAGIITNGDVNHGPGSPFTVSQSSPEWDDGDIFNVWIDYDGDDLKVNWSTNNIPRPATPQLARAIDIPALLGQQTGFVGFTAGTGSAWANHDILEWRYTPTIPEPTTAALLLTAAALTLSRRR
ncbi:L-type lectin-domain containing protein [Mucisphaera sp.]|uniref:L-type lectin-domain containing protein n=1 Tax=Mucisphaera sp. TaxID=2913024 RepID=UPI003D0F6D78